MKLGLYSITYRGIWYKGHALDVFQLVREAKRQGWEGLELDTERPHAAPMDMNKEDRKRLRDLAEELAMPICAVSPNCDLSSPIPSQREAQICYVRDCIELAHDLGSPICKIFAAWRGVTIGKEGVASYDLTYGNDPFPYWKEDRRPFVVDAVKELAKMAGDLGITLAMQNHGPDIVNNYKDTLALIRDVDSPHFKACMDINIEDEPESEQRAWDMAKETGNLLVHSHLNGEFKRDVDGRVYLAGAGYEAGFWGRKVVYPAYFEALASIGYQGYINWEFCHPAIENGKFAGIDYVNNQTQMAFEYMTELRRKALGK